MSSVLIIFGSTGGNTELVTDKVSEVLSTKHTVTVQRAELTKESDLTKYKYLIFACSTYGQGLMQEHMMKFMYYLKSLKGKKCAVIGLGDPKYNVEYVVESAKTLETKIKEKDGELLTTALRIVKSPVPHLNTSVKDWATKLSKLLK